MTPFAKQLGWYLTSLRPSYIIRIYIQAWRKDQTYIMSYIKDVGRTSISHYFIKDKGGTRILFFTYLEQYSEEIVKLKKKKSSSHFKLSPMILTFLLCVFFSFSGRKSHIATLFYLFYNSISRQNGVSCYLCAINSWLLWSELWDLPSRRFLSLQLKLYKTSA